MAGVCFGPATRPLMLQYYPRWKASSTQRTSVLMYGVLLESSLYADWSNVPRVILDMLLPRAISTRYSLKINDEKEQFPMVSCKNNVL